MGCARASDVERYHDGQLKLDERGRLEAHFQTCIECRQLLRELGSLSSLVRSASLAEAHPACLMRLQSGSRATIRDHKTFRLAGWLTATAAAVLICALLLSPERGTEPGPSPETWEAFARATAEDLSSDSAVMAQWMADELSSSQQR